MKALLLVLLVAACADSGPPGLVAGDCTLHRLAELPLTVVGTVPVVSVQINGKPAALVLDTGSDATVLTRVAARRLGIIDSGNTHSIGGAGGAATVGEARIESLMLGPIDLGVRHALLADSPRPPLDGVLGIDAMVDDEVALDVPRRRVTFYRARPCASAAPDWTGPTVALPVQQQPGSGHLFVSVLLDNQPLRGLLDTGASRSVLSLQSAEDAGISGRRLAALPGFRGQAFNRAGIVVRSARFRTLRIGADTLADAVLGITDLPPYAGDLLVGDDYLGTRRVWFQFLLGRVFVSADTPQ